MKVTVRSLLVRASRPRTATVARARWAGAAFFSVLLTAVISCSLLVDDSQQCSTDDDCNSRFGNHPYCQNGFCVASGLGPPGCYYGTATTPPELAGACTTATCTPFDNCARLGLCGSTALPALRPPVAPDSGAPATDAAPVGAPTDAAAAPD